MSLMYDYTDISPPGFAQDTITGINDLGEIVGYTPYTSSTARFEIFTYSGGSYAIVGPGPGLQNFTGGINNLGQFVGYYEGVAFQLPNGFLYNGSAFQTLSPAHFTHLTDINDTGQIVGNNVDGNTGFLLDSSGNITDLNGHAGGINNAGQVVGSYSDTGGTHGFIYNNGTYTTLDDPLATDGTFATAINDTGQIVGAYYNASGEHGFLYNAGTFYTVDNPLGVGGTYLTGINDYGQIVGNYIDSDGISHGFLGNIGFSAEVAGATVYTAEYGFAPDAAELNVLIDFTTPQYAYGQQIGVLDPTIYAFEALGVALASTATYFQDTYGPTVPTYPNSPAGDAQFATDAYLDVFGHAATSAQVDHFIAQLDYFETLYTAAGVFGSAENIDLLARGAVYGQMLGFQAELDPFGPGGISGLVPLVGMSADADTTHLT